ncbi:amidohydrolase family protein [Piscirickettsia litoralis]|uniref:Adenosine deaminase domain-containing protein n=1 Tax=Piscirickettsia litoralis TaxID=1891921 RepID=A0ABX3ACK8_9GAMM|nr:hypothetical protein [Piscirickettsia litoralis]ODN43904.1 hypothetical protein BGC07_14685 [Piscirickettsia litoralis]
MEVQNTYRGSDASVTVCPLSNIKLCVFNTMQEHNLKQLLDYGLCVTVNTDDPSYFGGYMLDNYLAVQEGLSLSKSELAQLAKNSINSSFLEEKQKRVYLNQLDNMFAL